ncbi:threonine aldolase [Deinococcus malanensis]|uniref:Threonine aldolase n=1 Tax=Deinococcus malanensis TaxID=1706855 RepID=A0ABQ2EM40_9DEIO|nr:low specificity L-threonine aldolase [Deinococcus malanensis]GGK14245.1 threonine aldolase [Deinococcus malanensis]
MTSSVSVLADFRSDTVTTPTPEMRQAMAQAAVGDDVYGEDPTVNALQAELARITGFEAGLFMPSGTMTNQVAIALHTRRGEEVVCAEGSHIYEWELGMMAAFSGVVPRFVPAPLGVPDPEDVRLAIRRSIHQSPTGMISLENTHNKAGGTIIPLDVLAAIRGVAQEEGLPLHLDGARVFNAAAALDVPLREITRHFDTVSICLSKGLGAPVGSVLLGSAAHMKQAHRYRKMMGGGMRQAGVLAAAALVAVRDGPTRLAQDHRRTQQLAQALVDAGLNVDLQAVQTNIIYARMPQAQACVDAWAAKGVLASALGPNSVRFVLHHQVTDDGLETAIRVLTA